MQRGLLVLLIGLISIFAGVNGEIEVAFLEEKENSYLQTASKDSSLDGSSLLSSAAALLNIDPSIAVDSEQSGKIASIVTSRPFDSAKALLGLTIAGLKQGDVLEESSGVRLAGEADLLKGLISLQQIRSAEQVQLDTTFLPGCGEPCLEHLLLEAIDDLGLNASYVHGQGALRGEWTFRGSQSLTTFELEEVSDRLFALETVSFWAAAKDFASENARRALQNPEGYTAPQILTRTFISPHMIKQSHGLSSEHFAIVQAIFKKLVASAQQTLQTSYNGRMVSILTTLENVDDREENDLSTLVASLNTSPVTRRSLLASEGDSAFLESFIAWVAMWGTFILLVFFALAGCHCLKGMKFKQDSLLYGKNKSE